ncbi:MAG: hypothetical protein PUK73_00625 [Spirochaetota bacterium]|uniref:hypothetical protein n=1 Tax=Candidatus Avelusimicrobium faecicola TaxID=3416205 RepID=UPI002A5FDF46|nr:hypothetical protein [Spirochaetota bacterium]
MNKLEMLTQSLQILTELSADMQQQIANAQEGVSEKSANLIMGSLAGIEETALHIKNIYEAMVFMHRR